MTKSLSEELADSKQPRPSGGHSAVLPHSQKGIQKGEATPCFFPQALVFDLLIIVFPLPPPCGVLTININCVRTGLAGIK